MDKEPAIIIFAVEQEKLRDFLLQQDKATYILYEIQAAAGSVEPWVWEGTIAADDTCPFDCDYCRD